MRGRGGAVEMVGGVVGSGRGIGCVSGTRREWCPEGAEVVGGVFHFGDGSFEDAVRSGRGQAAVCVDVEQVVGIHTARAGEVPVGVVG